MSFPSVTILATRLHIPRETALEIRKVLDGRTEPDTCGGHPRSWYRKLATIDRLLGTHGVETLGPIGPASDPNHGIMHPRARRFIGTRVHYCNAGDPYTPTVAYCDGQWYVARWAYFLGDSRRLTGRNACPPHASHGIAVPDEPNLTRYPRSEPAMWDTFYTVRPYLDTAPSDYPREILFLANGDHVRVVSRESDGSDVVRFQAGPYRPGIHSTEQSMADDVAGFALAYVERPDEFDRTPNDTEQVHGAWWRTHGDTITSALLPDEE